MAVISVTVKDKNGLTATATATANVTAPSAWPNASNTGVPPGTVLTNFSGTLGVNTAGTVIQNRNIKGNILIKAENVTVKNCRIDATGLVWGIDADQHNTNVFDCEIFGASNSAVLGKGGTYQRLNIYKCDNGIVTEGNNLIQDCYIHDLGVTSEAHVDGVSIQAGSNTTVRHNHIESWDTSCIFIKDDFSPINNILIDGNRLINTPGKKTAYTVYSDGTNPGRISGVKFTNNIMQKGNWGYHSVENNTVVWTNNTDYTTGALIQGP